METKKKVRKPSSSSDSSSDSGSESSSSSSPARHKQKHRNIRKRRESSSSSEENVKVARKHHHKKTSSDATKKSSARKHSHAAKIRVKISQSTAKKTARSMSPTSRAAHKHHLKKLATKKSKLAQLEEHERHSKRSRTPTARDVKKDRTPDRRISSPHTRIRVSVPNNRVRSSPGRSIKEAPANAHRRHIREPIDDKERAEILARCQERQRERDRLRRLQEEELHTKDHRYKPHTHERVMTVSRAAEKIRVRVSPEKHLPPHHERSRSHSRGKIPIRERLDKDFERDYHRSISREQEEYPIMRGGGVGVRETNLGYRGERPLPRDEREPERGYEYRRAAGNEYAQPARTYDERHPRTQNWDEEPREWQTPSSAHPKRVPDEHYKEHPRDRSWNAEQPVHDKWSNKEKEGRDWNRSSWKDSPIGGSHHSSGGTPSTPTMPHARRWPGPQQSSGEWTPRPSLHHSSHKNIEHGTPNSGPPPFKPRHAGPSSAPPYSQYSFKRFPFSKRFPNQFSKINFSSKRILPSATATSPSILRTPTKSENAPETSTTTTTKPVDIEQQQQQAIDTPNKLEASESGEIATDVEEGKVEADTTSTFSGIVDNQSQEECEGNLSEFSDVDDEILNREEVS